MFKLLLTGVTAIAALLLNCQAHACQSGERLAFSCTTTKGKVVEVCSAHNTAAYSYGRPGAKPELFLRKAKSELRYELSSGSGEGATYLTFSNGNATYTIESGEVYTRDYGDGTHVNGGKYAGLSADVAGRNVAEIQCREGTIRDHLDVLGIDAKMM